MHSSTCTIGVNPGCLSKEMHEGTTKSWFPNRAFFETAPKRVASAAQAKDTPLPHPVNKVASQAWVNPQLCEDELSQSGSPAAIAIAEQQLCTILAAL